MAANARFQRIHKAVYNELETVARAHADGFAHYAEAFVAHALSADYTLGAARLPLEARGRVLRRTRDHVAALRDEHLGADAAQETFLRLWNRIRQRREPEQHGAWLRRVAVTAALDLKRRRRTRLDAAEVLERPADGIGAEGSPAGAASVAELRRSLEAALEWLPEGQRTVFLLRYQGGLTLEDVGRSLGIAQSTVRTHFARACLKLQDRLRPHSRELEDPS